MILHEQCGATGCTKNDKRKAGTQHPETERVKENRLSLSDHRLSASLTDWIHFLLSWIPPDILLGFVEHTFAQRSVITLGYLQ